MSVIASVYVPADEFPIGRTLVDRSGTRLRLARVVPLEETLVPYLWVIGDDVDGVVSALRDQPGVETVAVLDRLHGETLVRVEWQAGHDELLDTVVDGDATVLEATGESDEWALQLHFDEHAALSAFYRQCVDSGIPIEIGRVHNPGLPGVDTLRPGLTEKQFEALSTAFERGYFEVPRQVNVVELAAELGVSDTAVSQRLRRGISALLSATLGTDESEPTD